MKQFLIDTNICIYYLKGLYNLHHKFQQVHWSNCFISEITLAELKFGIENSNNPAKNLEALNNFLAAIKIIPIFDSMDFYAREKTKLRRLVTYELVMVTNNTSHFNRITSIVLEDWTHYQMK